jgi:hypothetical protein
VEVWPGPSAAGHIALHGGEVARQYVLQTDLDYGKQQETVQGAYNTCIQVIERQDKLHVMSEPASFSVSGAGVGAVMPLPGPRPSLGHAPYHSPPICSTAAFSSPLMAGASGAHALPALPPCSCPCQRPRTVSQRPCPCL